ncbi:MAG: hypothetical protein R6U20_10555 [Longimonas sp.]|uniref:hypothetical protein n=1 Tax=Longimonas sp. TaxID=2039626 RepID=UPI003976C029
MEVTKGFTKPGKRLRFAGQASPRILQDRFWQSSEEYTSSEYLVSEYTSFGDSIYVQVSNQVDALAGTYEILNKDALQAWAQTHPNALLALQTVPKVIAMHFADADLRLEVKSDPEEPSPPKLYVRIMTPMPISDAVDAFMRVNETLAPRLRKASDGDIVLTYDVVSS